VDAPVRFGALELLPVAEASDPVLLAMARRFADERGADPARQAVVRCPIELRLLVRTIWSLFSFACISSARRQPPTFGAVRFPENLHLLLLRNSPHGLVFNSGHTAGFGDAKHVPLRWPVDQAVKLDQGEWDRRIELACILLSRRPLEFADNPTVVAAGIAADLACAAMERRAQGVENVAAIARSFILLGSAYEALHGKGSSEMHRHIDVANATARLDAGTSPLGRAVFSAGSLDPRPPVPRPGHKVTRPVFVVAHLFHLRNSFAHGRVPADDDFTLPEQLNGARAFDAAMLVLAKLIGDDLSQELDCVVPGEQGALMQHARSLSLPWEVPHHALMDGTWLVQAIEKAILPVESAD